MILGSVAADCREFLDRQGSTLDPGEHVFGFEHQTRLRALCVALGITDAGGMAELTERYWSKPSERLRLRDRAIAGTHTDGAPDARRFIFSETRLDHFAEILAVTERDPRRWVVSDYGIADLEGAEPIPGPPGASYRLIPARHPSSIGMLMFYGFSPHPGQAVLQELPVRLICMTTAWCAEHGVPPETRQDWTTERFVEACRVAAASDLKQAVLSCFLLHEAGHLVETSAGLADDPLELLTHRTGLSPSQVISSAFPDPWQRATWSRLRQTSSLPDALYMLGDLTANVRAIALGADHPGTWAFMQAFNWRFVPPKGPLRVPRGNLALLTEASASAAQQRCIAMLLDVADEHLVGASASVEILERMESRVWRTLAQVAA